MPLHPGPWIQEDRWLEWVSGDITHLGGFTARLAYGAWDIASGEGIDTNNDPDDELLTARAEVHPHAEDPDIGVFGPDGHLWTLEYAHGYGIVELWQDPPQPWPAHAVSVERDGSAAPEDLLDYEMLAHLVSVQDDTGAGTLRGFDSRNYGTGTQVMEISFAAAAAGDDLTVMSGVGSLEYSLFAGDVQWHLPFGWRVETNYQTVELPAGDTTTRADLYMRQRALVHLPRYRFLFDRAPRLRQSPRDDFLGGAPRQGAGAGSATSTQGSARQGWTNTYR